MRIETFVKAFAFAFAAMLMSSAAYGVVRAEELPVSTVREGNLASNAHAVFAISLRKGEATELWIEQPEATLQIQVRDDTGRALPLMQNDAGRHARVRVTLVASANETRFDVDIQAQNPALPARYRISRGATHAASERDRLHARSEQAFAHAENLRRAAGSVEHGVGSANATREEIIAEYDSAFIAAASSRDTCLQLMSKTGHARYAFALGDYAEARKVAQTALRYSCGSSTDPSAAAEEAAARRTLGSAQGYLGNLAAAIAEQEHALALYRQTGDRRYEAMAQANLSANYRVAGATAKALAAASAALTLAEQIGDRKRAAFSRESIAAIHLQRGEWGEALAAYQATLEALRDAPYPLIEGMSWNDLGLLYRNLGDEAESLAAFDHAEAAWKTAGDQSGLAETLLNRGDGLLDAGDIDAARAIFEHSVQFDVANGFKREQAHALAGLGRCAMAKNEWEAARKFLLDSLHLATSIGAPIPEAAAHLSLGDLDSRVDQLPAALSDYEQAYRIAVRSGDDAVQIAALGSRARVTLAMDDAKTAHALIATALDLIESERAHIAAPQLRTGYFASQRAYYDLAIDIAVRLDQQIAGHGYGTPALEIAERARARALREELAERNITVGARAAPTLVAAERDAVEALRESAWSLAQTPPDDAAKKKNLQTRIDAAARRLDDARGRLRDSDPRYAALVHPSPLRVESIQKQLIDDNVVVLEYWLGESRSYVWRVTKQSVELRELPARAVIEKATDALRDEVISAADKTNISFEQLAQTSAETTPELNAQSLASMVLPADIRIPDGDTIAVIADGELQRIPFDMFEPIAAHDVVYLPSLAILQELRAATPSVPLARSIAIFADPVFDDSDPRVHGKPEHTPPVWRRLTHAQAEADEIAALFPESERSLQSGFAATRQAVLDMAWPRYNLVHFATHAVIDLRRPELSGIVLSLVDPQGAAQDGFLRMNDIYNLRLSAELIVLSVCDATRERGRGAEGMFGLSRAFFYAGAKRLLVSLWPVDDRASEHLMSLFYRHLIVMKQLPQDALRLAKAEMRGEQRWHAAYYWAGFVIHGDWR
ncbi:MAG TPA: CHAT domain-containing protein [Rudaea sp.]|nr:CHAT domain-containing protein [Rudaea sp.]